MVSAFTFLCVFINFLLFLLFLAQLSAMQHELRAVQQAAAGPSNKEHAQIERPNKLKNIRVAMGLMNSPEYASFCVSYSLCAYYN